MKRFFAALLSALVIGHAFCGAVSDEVLRDDACPDAGCDLNLMQKDGRALTPGAPDDPYFLLMFGSFFGLILFIIHF
jgi:hypothetical protein